MEFQGITLILNYGTLEEISWEQENNVMNIEQIEQTDQ